MIDSSEGQNLINLLEKRDRFIHGDFNEDNFLKQYINKLNLAVLSVAFHLNQSINWRGNEWIYLDTYAYFLTACPIPEYNQRLEWV